MFINTGRGRQVNEMDLVEVLEKNDTITAVLDVTFPEPPLEGHAFYKLKNVILTPHIAGSMSCEVARMGDYMLDEFLRVRNHQPCEYGVTLKMLETMA